MDKRPKSELKDVAAGIVAGSIYTDKHLKDANLLGSVFMPLIFMTKEQLDEMKNDLGMIYEHLSEAAPNCINGCPIFYSMHLLNNADTKIVLAMVKRLQKAHDRAMAKL